MSSRMARCLAGFLAVSLAVEAGGVSAQSRVALERTTSGFRLLRNGVPYSVKGVGGQTAFKTLAKAGGNSIRTWSTDGLAELLDAAQAEGLTVCVGLWLGHERHGFNYQDEASVLKQLNDCLEAVRRFKDHPAVLLWGIGNEMEGAGTNPAIWYAIDHIARACRDLDPDHPTMTVIAELGDSKVQNIERFCPHIDIVGVNSYGGIGSLAERYRAAGGSKPFIVTEHGPNGPWEVGKTLWGAPLEASSTEKAAQYVRGYQHVMTETPELCLGSYAFLWGHKQETTATWFGMLLPDGTRLGAVDAMTECWTGRPPENRCPTIQSLTLSKPDKLKPGDSVEATLAASDPESEPFDVKWVLRHDSGTVGVGGDFQAEEASFADALKAQGLKAVVTAPKGGGGYRLFAYVTDGAGGAAVANVPLFVEAPVIPFAVPRAKLPFVVYSDGASARAYEPSGYMGNTKAIRLTLNCDEEPFSGKSCLKIEYQAPDQWGGVVWQSPANDWGDLPGGLNLSGAREVEFYVRGAAGGERVSFMLGVLDGQQKYRDSDKAELKDATLTKEWQKLRIPLDGRNLSRIKTGFGWSLAGQGQPVTFFLDEIRYVSEPAPE